MIASAHAEILNHDFTGIISPTASLAGNSIASRLDLPAASMAGAVLVESFSLNVSAGTGAAPVLASNSALAPRVAESARSPQSERPQSPAQEPLPYDVLALGLLTVGATAWRQRSSTSTAKFSA